jgi:hypothetical protein
VLDLSLAFGEEGSLASCATKQVADPALADETKLDRAAILAMLIHDQPPLLAVARGRPCRRGEESKPDILVSLIRGRVDHPFLRNEVPFAFRTRKGAAKVNVCNSQPRADHSHVSYRLIGCLWL